MKHLKTYEELEFTKFSEYENHSFFYISKYSDCIHGFYGGGENWKEAKKYAKIIYDKDGPNTKIDHRNIITYTLFDINWHKLNDSEGYCELIEYLFEIGFNFNGDNEWVLGHLSGSDYNIAGELYMIIYRNINYDKYNPKYLFEYLDEENVVNSSFRFQDYFLSEFPEKIDRLKKLDNIHPKIKEKYKNLIDADNMGLL